MFARVVGAILFSLVIYQLHSPVRGDNLSEFTKMINGIEERLENYTFASNNNPKIRDYLKEFDAVLIDLQQRVKGGSPLPANTEQYIRNQVVQLTQKFDDLRLNTNNIQTIGAQLNILLLQLQKATTNIGVIAHP